MRDTRDPSNTLESLPACGHRAHGAGGSRLSCWPVRRGRCPRCRAAPDRARKPRPRCCPTKAWCACRSRSTWRTAVRPGRAGRHRVHAPGRGPASADGDQPRPGRRRRRPRKLGRARYATAARYFTDAGFVVAVPVRLGYGATGGPDLENSGPCGDRRFTPMFNRAASEIAQVIEAMARRPDVDPANVVALGQSVGGGSTVALAAAGPAGVRAAINFAGGSGGDPVKSPGKPCGPERLQETYAGYAATTRMPMLWIYTENDLYWGRNGRNAGPRPTTPPAAMRNSNAWGRTATTAIRCSRMRPRNGSRWCATSCVRRVTPCRSRARHPARRAVPERKRGRERFHPPAAPRQATPPLARSTWPLTQPPSGPARNATTPAMSSAGPAAPAAAAWRSARSVPRSCPS